MEKVILENQNIYIEVIPSCGGKIDTLISKTSGRQWLWHNPNLPLRQPRYGDSYTSSLDSGGWDEIFPSVVPCRIALREGRELVVPDHGDVVALPVSVRQFDSQTLVTMTTGRCADFEFRREIYLFENVMVLSYKVTNTGVFSFPFLWSAHPLLHFEKGMKISFGGSIPFTVASAFGVAPFQAGDSFRWAGSNSSEKIADPEDVGFEPFAMKLFSDSQSASMVTLSSVDGQEQLVFSWDTSIVRHLGVWMNYDAWSGSGKTGSWSLGIEPTTSPFDGLGQAVENHRAILLEPGGSRRWSMEVAVQQCRRSKSFHSDRQPEHLLK